MTVTIKPVTPDLPAVVFGPAGFETTSGGTGGWESLDRPRRAAAAGWVGTPSRTLTVPLMLDGLEAAGGPGYDASVEPQCAAVESWGQPHPATEQPPILQIYGLRLVGPGTRWVVQEISWGEYINDSATQSTRIQQQLTLTLLQYFQATLVRGPAAKARDRQAKKKKPDDAKGKGKAGKK